MPRRPPRTPKRTTILWVDDDLYTLEPLLHRLRHAGHRVVTANEGGEAFSIVRKHHSSIDLVILDIMMSPGISLDGVDTFDGRRTGLVLARTLRHFYPNLPLLACSIVRDQEVISWFEEYGGGYLQKPVTPRELLNRINRLLDLKSRVMPRCFIVHGHDHTAVYELKNYIQNSLGLGEPVILREQPSHGKTLVEKFEEESQDVDVVFVLLTPDDPIVAYGAIDSEKRRARQNVVFELGFFYSKLQRHRGRVLLLYKGGVDLPSDLLGIAYIDISAGIDGAGEAIRRELREWL